MFVPQGSKATLWLPALRLDAAATLTVPQMKSVTLFLAMATLARNANPFATLATVPGELSVLPETTGRFAPAGIP